MYHWNSESVHTCQFGAKLKQVQNEIDNMPLKVMGVSPKFSLLSIRLKTPTQNQNIDLDQVKIVYRGTKGEIGLGSGWVRELMVGSMHFTQIQAKTIYHIFLVPVQRQT